MKKPVVLEVRPDIFTFDLFTKAECDAILALVALERERQEHPPNSMNRYGVILDGKRHKPLLAGIVDRVRPIARDHYLDIAPLNKYPYAFVVDYAIGQQRSLARHFDSSDVTLNVCLGESFDGGKLVFCGRKDERFEIEHVVGRAIVHRGTHEHRAEPIVAGRRSNLILWCQARAAREVRTRRKR